MTERGACDAVWAEACLPFASHHTLAETEHNHTLNLRDRRKECSWVSASRKLAPTVQGCALGYRRARNLVLVGG